MATDTQHTSFVLETTHRESGKTTRQEFTSQEDRMAAFSRVDVHAYSYRLEEMDGGVE